ncbi:MAG TPA: ABC transporter permease [Pyrinomonadaceae bacterium]|jgi:predicted permease|nr:ABC transporter permease [Pyrinomonadaceae bacterium]
MTSASQDLRYSLRMLLKHKGFTVVSVLTLALGIGINTAMFSVLNTFLFGSLPYPQSERLVRVWRTSPHSQTWPHSAGNFFDQREQNTVFERMSAYNYTTRNLTEPGQTAERLRSLAATADFFPLLGVPPAHGRLFKPEEFEPGADNVIVLSDGFWARRFGSDPNVVGQKIQLDGKSVEVVGVMPPGFEHPILWGPLDIWQPMAFTPEGKTNRGTNYLSLFGRLKPGVSIQQANESMVTLAANIGQKNSSNVGESVRLEPLQRSMSDTIGRTVMWFTFGLAGFVLLIACANLANLQLVRTATRSRELAVRAALGAGRWRLLRHSFTESILVALIGGVISLLVALGAVRFISVRLFADLPGARVQLDYKVFGFALLCSLVTGVLFGTIPAWLASRADVNLALRENSRGSTAGRSQHRLRHLLVVGEVAFAMVLLAAAGLFLRGLQRFINADPGWQVDGLMIAQMTLRGEKYKDDKQRVVFLTELENRLRALPGVEHVGIGGSHPVFGFNSSSSFLVEGRPEPPPEKLPEMFYEPVSSDYFATLGAHLLQGRTFNAADSADHPAVVIINEFTARTFWPNESPIGKRISSTGQKKDYYEVVGVVNDIAFPGTLGEPYTRYEAFLPVTQAAPDYLMLVLRSSSNPEAITNSLRSAVAGLDPELPVNRIRTARQSVNSGLGDISLLGSLLGAFATIGVILAAVGIYGVVSYTVVQRTGEFGIRMALGAQPRDVLRLVLSKGALLVAIGALLGGVGAYGVSKLLISLIPSLPTRDPLVLPAAALALGVVALAACYIPARRATRVDPLIALKSE